MMSRSAVITTLSSFLLALLKGKSSGSSMRLTTATVPVIDFKFDVHFRAVDHRIFNPDEDFGFDMLDDYLIELQGDITTNRGSSSFGSAFLESYGFSDKDFWIYVADEIHGYSRDPSVFTLSISLACASN